MQVPIPQKEIEMFIVMCKRTQEKKWWANKVCATEAEAKKWVANARKTDREYHHTGAWLYEIQEMTQGEYEDLF